MHLRGEMLSAVVVLACVLPFCAALSDATPRIINGTRVVYGTDNRQEHADQSLTLQAIGDSTVVLMRSNMLSCSSSTCTASGWSRLTAMDVCPSENFASQYIPGFCSGFLISKNQIATAGHCLRTSSDCSSVRFVFGFIASVNGAGQTTFPTSDVYRCKTFKSILDGPIDFAVVTLDRDVTTKAPLQLTSTPSLQTAIYVVGHPSGLPRKYAGDATVRSYPTSNPQAAWFFTSDLDTFAGNSGSAVFTSNNRVAGILVRGAPDYAQKAGESCLRVNLCSFQNPFSSNCFGEDVTLARTIKPFVPITCQTSADCSSNGICNTLTGKCSCNSGFHGEDCSFNCNENICQNGGKCAGLWDCNCPSGFGSDLCYTSSATTLASSANIAATTSAFFAVLIAFLFNI